MHFKLKKMKKNKKEIEVTKLRVATELFIEVQLICIWAKFLSETEPK